MLASSNYMLRTPKTVVFPYKNTIFERINIRYDLQLTKNQPVTKPLKNCRFLDRRTSWWKISQNREPFLSLFVDKQVSESDKNGLLFILIL